MCIIKFSTQQRNGIHDMTNNLKIMSSVRGRELTFFAVFMFSIVGNMIFNDRRNVLFGWCYDKISSQLNSSSSSYYKGLSWDFDVACHFWKSACPKWARIVENGQNLSFFARQKHKFPVKMTGMTGPSMGPGHYTALWLHTCSDYHCDNVVTVL